MGSVLGVHANRLANAMDQMARMLAFFILGRLLSGKFVQTYLKNLQKLLPIIEMFSFPFITPIGVLATDFTGRNGFFVYLKSLNSTLDPILLNQSQA
jgi:hypothetical protein